MVTKLLMASGLLNPKWKNKQHFDVEFSIGKHRCRHKQQAGETKIIRHAHGSCLAVTYLETGVMRERTPIDVGWIGNVRSSALRDSDGKGKFDKI